MFTVFFAEINHGLVSCKYYPPKTNMSPLKSCLPNRKVVFQPSIFRGYVKLQVCRYDVSFILSPFVFEVSTFNKTMTFSNHHGVLDIHVSTYIICFFPSPVPKLFHPKQTKSPYKKTTFAENLPLQPLMG